MSNIDEVTRREFISIGVTAGFTLAVSPPTATARVITQKQQRTVLRKPSLGLKSTAFNGE